MVTTDLTSADHQPSSFTMRRARQVFPLVSVLTLFMQACNKPTLLSSTMGLSLVWLIPGSGFYNQIIIS